MIVKIECSARHCHLTQEDYYNLTNKYELEIKKELSIEGEFLSTEKLTLLAGVNELNLSVIGPFREKSQIEISKSDAFKLAISPPVNISGDFEKALPCHLYKRVNKSIYLKDNLIIAQRHIHIPEGFNFLSGGEYIQCFYGYGPKDSLSFTCKVRKSKCKTPIIHLDVDEYNGFRIDPQNSFCNTLFHTVI